MREKTIQDICNRLDKILFSENYKNNLASPKVNWIDVPINEAIENVLEYLNKLLECYEGNAEIMSARNS